MGKNVVFLSVFYIGASLEVSTLFFQDLLEIQNFQAVFPSYHWNETPNILINQFSSHNVHIINEGKRERKEDTLFV